MDKIPFMKLSGAGNDFVIINNFAEIIDSTDTNFVTKALSTPYVSRRRRRAPRGESGRC